MLEKGDVIELCYGEPPYSVFEVIVDIHGGDVYVYCVNDSWWGVYNTADKTLYIEQTARILSGVGYNIVEKGTH